MYRVARRGAWTVERVSYDMGGGRRGRMVMLIRRSGGKKTSWPHLSAREALEALDGHVLWTLRYLVYTLTKEKKR